MAEPLLNLDTLVERDTVRIVSKTHPDGKNYELRNPDEIGVLDSARIRSKYRTLVDLAGQDDVTEEQAEKVEAAGRDFVKIVCIGIEDDVLDDLSDSKRTQLLTAWLHRHKLLDASGEAEGPPTTGVA